MSAADRADLERRALEAEARLEESRRQVEALRAEIRRLRTQMAASAACLLITREQP